jgi:hypothetical protein
MVDFEWGLNMEEDPERAIAVVLGFVNKLPKVLNSSLES